MTSVELRSQVGSDGVLTLQLPIGVANAKMDGDYQAREDWTVDTDQHNDRSLTYSDGKV